jgi:hypothetical protein
MSFDLFLTAFRNGDVALADVAAARAVLERFQHSHDPEFGYYRVKFIDGSDVELFATGLDGGDEPFDGGMFALRGQSEAIASFIFEFSRAAGCVIFPTMEPASVLLPREDLAAHLPPVVNADFRSIPVANGAELLAALDGGYDAWRAYRDQVSSRSSGDAR